MNHHPNASDPGRIDPSDALRWQLRGMRREIEPARDLWPGIAARLIPQAPEVPARPTRLRARWLAPTAMAASVLLVAGTFGWALRGPAGSGVTAAAPPTLVQQEAEGLTREYQAALAEMRLTTPVAAVPAGLAPTIESLDRDAALIRDALRRDPDSVRLLEQLRRTYAHRLALVQRLAYT